MNTAQPPENGQYSANQQRPFFYAQPSAQLPFQNPWYLGQVYNPYCLPGQGYRSGNPYYPFYSVALHEYPGFYVPQPQMNTRMNRRPHFNPHPPSPMFYHATRFRHYSSPGKRTETKETQTDPRQQQQEYIPKKHQGTDSKGCDGGSTKCQSSGVGSTEHESNLDHNDMSMSPAAVVQERDFHNNACNASQYRSMPPGSYAYEKEEVRIEYGSGSPAAIQMWKSYKETIPIYDVAVKEIPDNVVQRDLFCEGVLYGPRTGEEPTLPSVAFSNEDPCKTLLPPKQSLDALQRTETLTPPVQSRESKLDTSKPGKPSPKLRAMPEVDTEARVLKRVEIANPVYDIQQAGSPEDSDDENVEAVKSSAEFTVVQDLHSERKSMSRSAGNEELKLTNKSNMWTDDSVQQFVPSPTWLACFDNVETNYDYDVYMSQRKQKRPSILSITSDELSSSRDEGSSMDNTPMSYFVPDYMLRKSVYSFRKGAEDSAREKIKSGGSLKEDDKPMQHASSQYDKNSDSIGVKVKDGSSRGRKVGVPFRGLSRRKLYSLKKKPRKSQSLSEPEDSEEYWVMERGDLHGFEEEVDDDGEEYYFQDNSPHGQMNISKGSFFKQIAQKRILWKPPKGTVPAQIIGWPVREKLKVKKKGPNDTLVQVHQPQAKEYDIDDYASYEKKQTAKLERVFKGMPEQNKSLPKSLGGKPKKKTSGATVEEYWVGRGAKPKFAEPPYYMQDPTKIKEPDKPPKKKGPFKPSKRKQTRIDPEEVETWEIPRSYLYRGRGIRRGGTRKK